MLPKTPTTYILNNVEGRKGVSAKDQFGNEWSSFDMTGAHIPEYMTFDPCCECGEVVHKGFVCIEDLEVACEKHFVIKSFKGGTGA